jgi:hypothetical protein
MRVLAWAMLLAIFLATDLPIEFRPTTGLSPNIERFAALFVAAVIFSLAYPNRILAVAVLLMGLICLLEFLQTLTVGRHASLHDVEIKSLGAILGAIAGYYVNRLWQNG